MTSCMPCNILSEGQESGRETLESDGLSEEEATLNCFQVESAEEARQLWLFHAQ